MTQTPRQSCLLPKTLLTACACLSGVFASAPTSASSLDVRLTSRWTAEYLENGFRPITPEYDHALTSKTHLLLEYQGKRFYTTLELEDSRAWHYEPNSPITSSTINTLEPLQLKVGWQQKIGKSYVDLALGRTTVHWQEGRIFGRQGHRNNMTSYTGLTADWAATDSNLTFSGIALAENHISPDNRDLQSVRDHDVQWDEINEKVQIYGLNVKGIDLIDFDLATYIVWYDETDSKLKETRDRELLNLGVHATWEAGRWQGLAESSLQMGQGRATTLVTDTRTLDIMAGFVHAEISTEIGESARLTLIGDYASGDGDPLEGTYTTYQPLYPSSRNGDFNLTSLFGPLRHSNLISPAVKMEWAVAQSAHMSVRARPVWQHALEVEGGGIQHKGNLFEALFQVSPEDSFISYTAGLGYYDAREVGLQALAEDPGSSLYLFARATLQMDWRFE